MNNSRIHIFANSADIKETLSLLIPKQEVSIYKQAMFRLGCYLGFQFMKEHSINEDEGELLVISTAEDADHLTRGFLQALSDHQKTYKIAVFWNNHYQLSKRTSIAPIVNSYLQPGYELCSNLVMLKSIISGSCVVRTNFMKLIMDIGQANLASLSVIAPVMYKDSDRSLSNEFPPDIHEKFNFYTFRIDSKRLKDGTVIPGIGGQIYPLLGLPDQPARMMPGYMPELVRKIVFS